MTEAGGGAIVRPMIGSAHIKIGGDRLAAGAGEFVADVRVPAAVTDSERPAGRSEEKISCNCCLRLLLALTLPLLKVKMLFTLPALSTGLENPTVTLSPSTSW